MCTLSATVEARIVLLDSAVTPCVAGISFVVVRLVECSKVDLCRRPVLGSTVLGLTSSDSVAKHTALNSRRRMIRSMLRYLDVGRRLQQRGTRLLKEDTCSDLNRDMILHTSFAPMPVP